MSTKLYLIGQSKFNAIDIYASQMLWANKNSDLTSCRLISYFTLFIPLTQQESLYYM